MHGTQLADAEGGGWSRVDCWRCGGQGSRVMLARKAFVPPIPFKHYDWRVVHVWWKRQCQRLAKARKGHQIQILEKEI